MNVTASALSDPQLRFDLARAVGRRIDASDIEDVVQATLAEAVAARGRLPREPIELRKFVFAIARQKVVDWYRKRGRDARRLFPGGNPDSVAAPASSLNGSEDLLRWVEKELPSDAGVQKTFEWMLREGQGETLAEIAKAEREAPTVVRQRVSRLRRYLRARWVKEVGIAIAIGLLGATILIALRKRADPVAEPLRIGLPPDPQAPSIGLPPPPPAAMSAERRVPGTAPSALPAAPVRSVPVRPVTAPRQSSLTAPLPSSSSVASPSNHVPESGADEFNRAAAARALTTAALDLGACAAEPSGSGHVTVTFGTSGEVVSAVVDSGPLVGTDAGECIAARFSKVSVPAFSGAPVRVGKSFTAAPFTPKAGGRVPVDRRF